jgi:hypothetical protein
MDSSFIEQQYPLVFLQCCSKLSLLELAVSELLHLLQGLGLQPWEEQAKNYYG